MPISLLTYDDNEVIRNSLAELIATYENLELLASMPNAETVLADIEQFNPDAILMDIDMPVVNGVDAVKTIRKTYKDLPVIMLTVFDDNGNIFNAICAGASGYVLKPNVTEELYAAIKMVLEGGAPMTGVVARKVLQLMPNNGNEWDKANILLSARETHLLQLLVAGYSYKMIAAEMQVSIDTVRYYIKKVYEKLQVNNAPEAVSKALKDKLIE